MNKTLFYKTNNYSHYSPSKDFEKSLRLVLKGVFENQAFTELEVALKSEEPKMEISIGKF
jgi:hypothetical protein